MATEDDAQGVERPQPFAGKIGDFVAKHRLSPRESEVLVLLLRGVHPKAMGNEIGCRYASVRTHLSRMYRKLGCSGARELVLRFFAHASGIITSKPARAAL
ncbi:MAG TPA: helix-turn-helix transcriptional regulator [Polyangiaceae bacterium]